MPQELAATIDVKLLHVNGLLRRLYFTSAFKSPGQPITAGSWFEALDQSMLSSVHIQPYLKQVRSRSWIVRRRNQTIGRIMAMWPARSDNAVGRFGFYNCIDEAEVSRLLTRAAEHWLKAQGAQSIIGPFNPSIHESTGLLESAHEPIQYGFPNTPKQLILNLESCGYTRQKRLLTFRQSDPQASFRLAERMTPLLNTSIRRGLKLEIASWATIRRDCRWLTSLINSCWKDNWGFEPFSNAEASQLLARILAFLPAGSLCFMTHNGDPIAIALGIPDARDAANRLPPLLGFLNLPQLVMKMRKGQSRYLRVALLGVVPGIQGTPLSLASTVLMIQHVIKLGLSWGCCLADMGWILEDNEAMIRLLNLYGGKHVMSHVVMGKNL